LGATRFRERFLAETGFTPHEYQARAQVQEAKHLLSATELPITDIAFELNYSSSQYFATVFRRLAGITPQAYRRLHQQRHKSAGLRKRAGSAIL
jgi:AraC-like DNA-binding protein